MAACGGPGIDGLFAWLEVCGAGSDSEGITREEVRGVDSAAELGGRRRVDLAKTKDDASGEPVGVDVADAACDLGRVDGAVVDVRVLEVSLDGADGDAVVKEGKDEVDAAAAGDSPAPGAGLECRTADLGTAAEDVDKGNQARSLIAKNGARLGGAHAADRTGEDAAFSLDSEVAIEVRCGAEDRARVDGLIRKGADGCVTGIEVSVAGVEIKAR